jgi:hypothetical protein
MGSIEVIEMLLPLGLTVPPGIKGSESSVHLLGVENEKHQDHNTAVTLASGTCTTNALKQGDSITEINPTCALVQLPVRRPDKKAKRDGTWDI